MTRAGGSRGKGRHVVLWRHGRTAWNTENRFQGHLDVELDDRPGAGRACRAPARRAASRRDPVLRPRRAPPRQPRRWPGGPGWRCCATPTSARPTAGPGRATSAARSRRWTRRATGAWRAGEDVGPRRRRREPHAGRRAGRRGGRSAASRSWARADILVVVTHGGTARATIGRLLGLPVEHWDVFGGLANAAWSMLEETSSGSLAARRAQRRHPAAAGGRRRRLSVARACGASRFRGVEPERLSCGLAREGDRGCGAAGSAPAWHAGGQGFESPQLHHRLVARLLYGSGASCQAFLRRRHPPARLLAMICRIIAVRAGRHV